jgi:hypothetical protein
MRYCFLLFIFIPLSTVRADPAAGRQNSENHRRAAVGDTSACQDVDKLNCSNSSGLSKALKLVESKVVLCRAIADSPQCQDFSAHSEDKSKFLNCDPAYICQFKGQSYQDAESKDCVLAGLESFSPMHWLDMPEAVIASIGKSRDCDENKNDEKTKIISGFNDTYSKQIELIQGQLEAKMNLPKAQPELTTWQTDIGDFAAATKKLKAVVIPEDLKLTLLKSKGPTCQEIRNLLDRRLESYNQILNPFIANGIVNVPRPVTPIAKLLKDLGLKLECYSPKAKGEAICQAAIIVAAAIIRGPALATARSAAMTKLENLGASRPRLARLIENLSTPTDSVRPLNQAPSQLGSAASEPVGSAKKAEVASHSLVEEPSNHNRDFAFVPKIARADGTATVAWDGIRDRIEKVAQQNGIDDYKEFTASVYVNGVEVKKGIPWGQTNLTLPEAKNGQIDYYVVYKKGDTVVDSSNWNMRETKDMRTLADGSFTGLSPGENFHVHLSEDLKAHGVSEELTKTAVRLGNQKVVWNLSPDARPRVRDFVSQAVDGVDVKAEIGKDGKHHAVTIRDRKTGKSISAEPKEIILKGDAAFSGNQFFWDDMWVAGGSVEHNPTLARSTIESWLDAHDLTNGPIPREIRKENSQSLWFPETVRFPEGPKANLTYTNPYLMNWAADKLYRYNPSPENLELLKRVSKSIDKYTAWMEDPKSMRAIRDSDGKIIGFNGSALGTGLDNSRMNVGNSNELAGHQRGFVDFLSQHIAMLKDNAQWQLLFARDAKTAELKAQYVAKARELSKKAADYTKIMNEKYWDPDKKFYYDIQPNGKNTYAQDHSTTPVSGFWPLFANAADRERVNQMVETQMVPSKFGGTAPMPSNSRDTVTWEGRKLEYQPRRDKDGKIIDDGYHDAEALWNPNASMSAQGLRRSGRPDIAHQVSRDFNARMADSSTTTVEEAYGVDKIVQPDGSTKMVGRPLAHGTHPHRADFAGWGKVPPIDGVVQDVIGLAPTARQGLEWNVRTPLKEGSPTDRLGVANLQYAGGNVKQLELRRVEKNVYELTVESENPFDLRIGSLLNEKDILTDGVKSRGPKIHVLGGNKVQKIRIQLAPTG